MLDGRRHLIVAMDDITELKTSEQRLRRLQNLLTETEEMGKVGGWEFDIETGHQIWTEEVYRIHEVDHSFDPTVATGIQFYSPASRPVIERAVQRAIEQGEPFDLKLQMITAQGNHRHVHAIGKADRAQHKVFGFFQDITARQQAETKVAEQLDELLRWHDAMEGRESRVLELKQEINELLLRVGQPVRYASAVGGGEGSEQSSVNSEQLSVSRNQPPMNSDR
jgi:hypothetical protein